MSKIVTPIGSDIFTFKDCESYAVVSRVGHAEFSQAYEDRKEALRFFAACVGAAYMRHNFPDYVDAVTRLDKEES